VLAAPRIREPAQRRTKNYPYGKEFVMAAHSKSMTNRPGMDQLREKSSDIKHNLQEMGTAAKQAAREQLSGVRESMVGYYEQGRDKAIEFEHSLENRIREKPLSSVLVATGLGFLIGLFWMRK
jgi:ElaB/YqjD/DUF883 family membrane-anchored ribosome-binding protein